MRSLIWTSVFLILMVEIAIVTVLVIPVPRSWRNGICMEVSKLDLKEKLRMPLTYLVVGMCIAFFDSLSYLLWLWNEEEDERRYSGYGTAEQAHALRHMDKENEYKMERNLYLSGFAVALLFAIGRITDLMQEHAELETELEKKRLAGSPAVDASTGFAGVKANTGLEHAIEMKPLKAKKKE